MSDQTAAHTASSPTTEIDPANTSVIYQHIISGVEKARAALEEVGRTLTDFDNRHKATEKASAYLGGAIAKANTALTDLGKTAQSLRDGATEIPVRALTTGLANAGLAFSQIAEVALKYDEQFQLSTKLSSVLAGPREQASVAIAASASSVAASAAAANAQLQGVSDGLRASLTRGLDKALPAAVRADETLHVVERAAAAGTILSAKIKELDERYGLSGYVSTTVGHAQTLDQKVTGGKVAPAILSAYGVGLSLVGFVSERFEEKKREHQGAIEGTKAPTPATTTAEAPATTSAEAPAAAQE